MAMPDVAIIVPARLGSTRFPRKLLHPVQGKPIILWTAERIRQVAPEYPLFFAVDDSLLYDEISGAGFQAIMTDPAHPSGTDRIAEANLKLKATTVINVQADEPLVTGEQIRTLHRLMKPGVDMATLASPLSSDEAFHNPNRVKVVFDRNHRALYFSRAPIPYPRDGTAGHQAYAHLGLYAYTAAFLKTFSILEPTPLEQTEKLEQLRALETGHTIAVGITTESLIGVDVPGDARLFEELLLKGR